MTTRRRTFLRNALLAAGALTTVPQTLLAKPYRDVTASDLRITKVSLYRSPNHNPTFNQSNHIVVVETDGGVTGIGEGGTRDTIEQLAGMLIGEDPFRIEHLWQVMYRGYFYPPGREKIHAQGALDMALWDIKGKALEVPIYELLGGLTRDYMECYATGFPRQDTLEATASACMDAGFRAYRISAADAGRDQPYRPHHSVEDTVKVCEAVRKGVGDDGDWCIDFHTRLDMAQAVRLCDEIEDLAPYFVEDLIRSENKEQYELLRQKVDVPIAVGEHFSDRWDVQPLVEKDLIDHSRITLPNAGGITEYKKIAAMCETHYVGLIPHFTGPIATAALVHVCGSSSGPVMMEMRGKTPREQPHLPESYDFREGKVYPNSRPGLGVTFDPSQATFITEITERDVPIPQFRRPDGSYTNW